MRRGFWFCFLPCFSLTLFRAVPVCVQAVAKAQIHGTITDPTGAVVPKATIKATQAAAVSEFLVPRANLVIRPGTACYR
jgi:hypothetical protein